MRRRIYMIALATTILLSGCSKSVSEPEVNESISEIEEKEEFKEIKNETGKIDNVLTLSSLKMKYGVKETDMGVSPLYNVDKEAKFTFHFNSLVDPFQAITVHTDRDCGVNSTIYTQNSAYFTKDGGIDVIVDRYYTPTLNVSDRLDYDPNLNTWGYAPKYYISINYDMDAETPTKLDEPIIIPFTVKSDVEVPIVNYEITNSGEMKLVWNKIDGVDGYRVYESYNRYKNKEFNRENGYIGLNLSLVDELDANTTEYMISEDSVLSDTYPYYTTQNMNIGDDYYITAVKDGKESNFGLEIGTYRYANQLPYKVDESVLSIGTTLKEFPDVIPVIMKDNTSINLPISFKLVDDTYAKTSGKVTYEYHVIGTKLGGLVDYEVPESGEYPKSISSKSTFNTGLYKTQLDLSLFNDTSFPVINDGKSTETDLTKLKTYNPNSRVVYNADALSKRLDMEMARFITNGVYQNDPNSIYVVDYNDRQNNLKEREKQLGDIFDVNGYDNITEESESVYESDETDNWWETIETRESEETIDIEESSEDNWWETKEVETESETEELEIEESETVELETEESETVDRENISNDSIDGSNVIDKKLESDEEKIKDGDTIELSIPDNYYISADSVEEEYLAINLINQEKEIRIDILPNLMDADVLVDTFMKVYFQNPYFMGYNSISLGQTDNGEVYLIPEYKYTKEEATKMQEEIYKEATNILRETVNPTMSEEEKLDAIWTYLEENTQYDYEALEEAEKTNFEQVPEKYNYVFNTYGILVKKLGVCQSYAYTMDLLLNMSGIDCITLTGYSDKTLPHAWNAIKKDGKYYWIDATANYNSTLIPYYLYESSADFALNNGYTLDENYELDSKLSKVLNSDDNKDWYIVNDLNSTSDNDIFKSIANGYNLTDKITYAVRMNYKPNIDEGFILDLANSLYESGVSEDDIMKISVYDLGSYMLIAKDTEEFKKLISE